VYTEVSTYFELREDLEETLPEAEYARLPLPWEAGFLAGKAYVAYRRAGGERRSPLPDFYIGAHAAIRGMRLLTRDPRRYRTYFPTVGLIAP
jgi:predicted nucleic acid-binding protein